MSRNTKRPFIIMPTEEEGRRITAAALADPDAQPLTEQELAEMVPLRSVRGRPKTENAKQLVSMRFSPEVLGYFRAGGDGWQTRINEVLFQYVRRRTK